MAAMYSAVLLHIATTWATGILVQFPVGAIDFYILRNVHTGSEAHSLLSYAVGDDTLREQNGWGLKLTTYPIQFRGVPQLPVQLMLELSALDSRNCTVWVQPRH